MLEKNRYRAFKLLFYRILYISLVKVIKKNLNGIKLLLADFYGLKLGKKCNGQKKIQMYFFSCKNVK